MAFDRSPNRESTSLSMWSAVGLPEFEPETNGCHSSSKHLDYHKIQNMLIRRYSVAGLCAILIATLAIRVSHSAQTPAEVKLIVMTSGGFTAASHTLFPAFERKANCKIVAVYGPAMGTVPDAIPNRLQRGEFADVVVLTSEALSKLVEKGKVVESSRADLADSIIGMAVRAGAPSRRSILLNN